MNENNELLLHIYQSADMGVKSTTNLLENIRKTENKIKKIVEDELKGYEEILKEAKELLEDNKVTPKDLGSYKEKMARMGIKMELRKDNSDAKIADMLTQGFTMGIIEMERKIDNYIDEVDKNIIKLAKKLKKFQKEQIEILKPYL